MADDDITQRIDPHQQDTAALPPRPEVEATRAFEVGPDAAAHLMISDATQATEPIPMVPESQAPVGWSPPGSAAFASTQAATQPTSAWASQPTAAWASQPTSAWASASGSWGSQPNPAWAPPDAATIRPAVNYAGYNAPAGAPGYQPAGYQGAAGYTAAGYPTGTHQNGGYPGGPGGYQPPNGQPVLYAGPGQPKRGRTGVVIALAVAVVLALTTVALAFRPTTEIATGGATNPRASQPAAPQTQPSTRTQPTTEPTTGTTRGVSAAQSAGVVLIDAETSEGTAAGTGMVLSADGKVLTNYHVVAGSSSVQVTVADSGDTYDARVVGFDQVEDVALLQLDGASGLTTVTTDDDTVNVSDAVAAVGNANGRSRLSKAAGQVTGLDQDLTVSSDSPWGAEEDLTGLIATDANAVPGDSGGPMFDSEGEVLGMTTAGSVKEGTSYAVPIATALRVVATIEAGSDVGTTRVGPAGFLGIQVATTGQTNRGVTITEVVDGSPADSAGVTKGSTLTKVGGTSITADTNVASVIRALEPGQQATIAWITPSGTAKQATVKLASSTVN